MFLIPHPNPTPEQDGESGQTLVAAAAALLAGAAHADITIGISLPLTGPASGLGIPMANYIQAVAAEHRRRELNVIVLDDATDPTKGVTNARSSSPRTRPTSSWARPPRQWPSRWPARSPNRNTALRLLAGRAAGRQDNWMFRLPQGNAVMAYAMIEHMKKQGVKTVGFLGYTDAYGELAERLQGAVAAARRPAGDRRRALRARRHQRHRAGAQAGCGQPRCDAGRRLPARAPRCRTRASSSAATRARSTRPHAAASRDLVRVGGKDVEGAFVSLRPGGDSRAAAGQPPLQGAGDDFVAKYEKAYGRAAATSSPAMPTTPSSCSKNRAGGAEEAKPGTKGVPRRLRDAVENMGRTVVSHGVLNYTKDNHWGFTTGPA